MNKLSTIAAESRTMEYDIALTLLNLHSGGNVSQQKLKPENEEDTTRLILNCLISSEVEVETSPSTIKTPSFRHLASPKPPKTRKSNDLNGASTSREKNNVFPYFPQKVKEFRENIKSTREIGTQTDDYLINESFNNNVLMNIKYRILYERMKTLEASSCGCQSRKTDTTDHPSSSEDNGDENAYDNTENDPDYDASMDYEEEHCTPTPRYRRLSHSKKSNQVVKSNAPGQRVLTTHNTNTKANDVVPIGEGNAKIPSRVLRHINWNSYSSATRKLLTAVFSRSILASHSLTGKPSPAFPNKPAKKRLNPALVNDIVQTVVERCNVPESVVRTSITTKCADESKMWRTRQKCNTNRSKLIKKIKEHKKNRENIPPATSGSEPEFSDY